MRKPISWVRAASPPSQERRRREDLHTKEIYFPLIERANSYVPASAVLPVDSARNLTSSSRLLAIEARRSQEDGNPGRC